MDRLMKLYYVIYNYCITVVLYASFFSLLLFLMIVIACNYHLWGTQWFLGTQGICIVLIYFILIYGEGNPRITTSINIIRTHLIILPTWNSMKTEDG